MESRLRAIHQQFSIMLDFMETNGDLSRPQPGAQGWLKMESQWVELSKLLNSVGTGVQKQPNKWKRVWSDLKSKTKKKVFLINRDTNCTRGRPSTIKALNPQEQRVLRIMGLQYVTGHHEVQEASFVSTEPASEHKQCSSLPQPAEQVKMVEASTSPVWELCHTPEQCNMELFNEASTSHAVPSSSNTERQRGVIISPSVPSTSRRRHLIRQRRRQHRSLFEQAADRFAKIEEGRLQLEEKRVQMEQERELERLRLDSQRTSVEQERNVILQRIGNKILEILAQSQTDGV